MNPQNSRHAERKMTTTWRRGPVEMAGFCGTHHGVGGYPKYNFYLTNKIMAGDTVFKTSNQLGPNLFLGEKFVVDVGFTTPNTTLRPLDKIILIDGSNKNKRFARGMPMSSLANVYADGSTLSGIVMSVGFALEYDQVEDMLIATVMGLPSRVALSWEDEDKTAIEMSAMSPVLWSGYGMACKERFERRTANCAKKALPGRAGMRESYSSSSLSPCADAFFGPGRHAAHYSGERADSGTAYNPG